MSPILVLCFQSISERLNRNLSFVKLKKKTKNQENKFFIYGGVCHYVENGLVNDAWTMLLVSFPQTKEAGGEENTEVTLPFSEGSFYLNI